MSDLDLPDGGRDGPSLGTIMLWCVQVLILMIGFLLARMVSQLDSNISGVQSALTAFETKQDQKWTALEDYRKVRRTELDNTFGSVNQANSANHEEIGKLSVIIPDIKDQLRDIKQSNHDLDQKVDSLKDTINRRPSK